MDTRYLEALPTETRRAVAAMETAVGSEIAVLPVHLAPEDVPRVGLTQADIYPDGATVNLTIWLDGKPSGHLIWHELRHMQFRVLDRQPEPVATDDADTFASGFSRELFNDIEHAWMVADEIAIFGDDARAYWAADFDKQLSSTRADALSPTWRGRARFKALRMLMTAGSAMPEWNCLPALRSLAAQLGLRSDVDRAQFGVELCRKNYGAGFREVLGSFGVDRKRFRLRRLDIANSCWRSELV